MLLTTTAKAPSCQWSSCMKNSSAAKNDAAHAKAAMCHFLWVARSTNAPTTGSRKALAMVAKLVR